MQKTTPETPLLKTEISDFADDESFAKETSNAEQHKRNKHKDADDDKDGRHHSDQKAGREHDSMAGEVDDLIIMYDSSVEITGRFHYKDELKIKEGSFGPCASFAILIEKPKKDKIAKHYIFARAYGEKIIEKLKRIEKGTFIRVIGELESGFGGTYVNVKVLTP